MFVDIHSHILPGIDDGPKNMDKALEMVRFAWKNGTESIIATPHFMHGVSEYEINRQDIDNVCYKLMGKVREEGIRIKIYPGSEVFITPNLPELLKKNVIHTLNNSLYVLVELPVSSIPLYFKDVLFRLMINDYIPVLAHPERNLKVVKKPEIIREYVENGMLVQINSSSLKGLHQKNVKRAAVKLLKLGLVHFVASDAHTTKNRNAALIDVMKLVSSLIGSPKATELFETNGRKVINNEINVS